MIKKEELINLDDCVTNALNLFINKPVSEIKIKFNRPLVVGSGNAAATGKIIFNDIDAVFADESNYLKKIATTKEIDGCIIISASGGKHAPIIAKEVKKLGIKSILLTNNSNAEAKDLVDKVYLFPKNPEPYTYNTSTYLGMILGKTREDPKLILDYIKKIDKGIPKNFNKFDSFFIIVPQNLELIREMFLTKFDELFGSRISARAFTVEQAKHSKTIIPSEKEFFISVGVENKVFGKNRLNIKLPKNSNYGTILSLGYYIIGKIQKQNKPYFKENLEKYTKETSKIFKEKINTIVI